MLYERWDVSGFDRNAAASLYKSGVNPLVAAILASRDITEPDDVKAFLEAEDTDFHDPFLLTDMHKAVAHIQEAVSSDKHIAVYGDYDVDGMTSAALLGLWLQSKGAHYEIYIPDRCDEGYSLNIEALDTLKSRGAQLVITVDCGIIAYSEAAYAKEIGLELIITDHHECKNRIPEALAVINPKRFDCSYPYKLLAGVGVVFKLICALEGGILPGNFLARYSQLAALGTVADVMPLTGENRKLVLHGLRHINSCPIPGLAGLINKACPDPANVTATTISYTLAPRLNAAGRIGSPMLSVNLLLCDDTGAVNQYVNELDNLNAKRRELEQGILDDALRQLGEDRQTSPIVLGDKGWHPGVTGIVATRIANLCKLPAVIISINEQGVGHGSCRSYGLFSIYEALRSCEDLLIDFGGHDKAAGIVVAADKITQLRKRIRDYYDRHMPDLPGLAVDFEVEKPEKLLNGKNIEAIECLEPFGTGNSVPCLCITGAVIVSLASIGAGKHTKLKIDKSGQIFDCIFFSVPAESLGITAGDNVDIAFRPQINEFRGRKSVQLQLSDIRRAE